MFFIYFDLQIHVFGRQYRCMCRTCFIYLLTCGQHFSSLRPWAGILVQLATVHIGLVMVKTLQWLDLNGVSPSQTVSGAIVL